MTTGLVYHPDYLKHDLKTHPENANRLKSIIKVLEEKELMKKLTNISPRKATIKELEYAHQINYINKVDSLCREGKRRLDVDTYISPSSFEVALLAVGGLLTAVDAIMEGKVENALALVRPPGHHAGPAEGRGFCLFNNIAIAARYGQKRCHLKKVLVIDWDVHHGNGTQDIFYEDPSLLYVSFHQSPLYPGTGLVEERGRGKGEGFNMNFPLPPGSSGEDYLDIFQKILIPRVQEFAPEIIFISAGFDGHRDDPIGGMNLTEEDFGRFTDLIRDVAKDVCQGRIVSALEGGYDLQALPRCVLTHLQSLKTS
ncbi:histone deacetylase [candidate division NPL-UPA2 bacterium]|nr:histone deacetylase [candidate division NPL-UPA2 bacterium]